MGGATISELAVDLGELGSVSAIWVRPPEARCALVFGHGAGAGMRHAFMEAMSTRLAERGIASFRYGYPYLEAGRKRPDSPKVLEATTRAAVTAAAGVADQLPLLAGGKSMGGRITSQCQAAEPLPGVRGLIFFGFPLHAPKKPASKRGEHLAAVNVPMLFLQGTRDALADLSLVEPLCAELGDRATLHVVEGADHSFKVLVRSGRSHEEVLDELADAADRFSRRVL